jgi:PAS domain S-box-containing protein
LKGRTTLSRRSGFNTTTLGIAALVLTAFVGLSFRQWELYHRANAEAARSREILTAIDSIQATLVDAETGQRGFLLTGDSSYLDPYNRALQEFPNDLATLKSLVSESGRGSENVDQLTTLANSKLGELRQTIETRRTQGAQAALAMVLTGQGRSTMDSVRALCAQMRGTENARQTQASSDGEAAAGIALLITVAGSLVLLFLFAFGLEPFTSPDPQAWQRPWLLRYGAAILAVVAITLIRAALTPVMGPTAMPFTLYFCAVAFAAWFGGFRPAVLAIFLSLVAGSWFFAAPTRSLLVSGHGDQVAMLMIVLVGFGIALLSRSQRGAMDRALRAESSERNERQRFETTLTSIGDAVIATDREVRVTFANQVALSLMRRTEAEVAGKPLHEVFRIVNEITRAEVENPAARVLRERAVVALANHTVLIAQDGTEVPIEDSAAPIFGPDGSLAGVVLVFRDVTETRKARARLSLALTAGKMGVYEIDLAHNTLWLSRESYSLLGRLPQDFSASPESLLGVVHPQDRELLQQHFKGTIEAHEPVNHEFRILRPSGKECWISCQGQVEYNDAGQAVRHSGLLVDITLRKQSEQMLRRFERLTAAARLSATMAHEINNPLGAVVNLVYLVRSLPGLPPGADQMLRQAEQELDRVAHATRQALGFYRETTSPEQIDIPALMESVLELYSTKLISKHISIKRAFGECAPIQGVHGEVKQAVSNFIANAIEAVTKGGVIFIGIESVPGDREGAAEIVIADNGPGIAQEDADKIFEPFFTTKSGTGMGLGLWVARDIVERHGGSIRVSPRTEGSELGGTTITIKFPRESRLSKEEQKTASDEPSETGESAAV